MVARFWIVVLSGELVAVDGGLRVGGPTAYYAPRYTVVGLCTLLPAGSLQISHAPKYPDNPTSRYSDIPIIRISSSPAPNHAAHIRSNKEISGYLFIWTDRYVLLICFRLFQYRSKSLECWDNAPVKTAIESPLGY